jgi:protein-tyrosine phosphatase
MWSSWTEKATKGFSEALEKTGEAISQAEKTASKGLTEAFEKTGEAITQAATKSKPRTTEGTASSEDIDKNDEGSTEKGSTEKGATEETGKPHMPNMNMNFPHMNMPNIDKGSVLKNLQMGWSSVIETTKRTVDATREVVEIEKIRLEQNLLRKKGFYKRDPKLPLDVEALRDAEVVYITDKIITMSHPAMASSIMPSVTAERKLAAIGHLLQRRHDGRFLIWNLSEVDYDISILDDQVLTFTFPGSPSPPLGLLLKLLVSMENWMKADERNVAVVHCLTGKGRTSTVLAAFLCWMGEAGFGDINQALAYIAKCKQLTPEDLTIPSQRRYASYFKNMLDGGSWFW